VSNREMWCAGRNILRPTIAWDNRAQASRHASSHRPLRHKPSLTIKNRSVDALSLLSFSLSLSLTHTRTHTVLHGVRQPKETARTSTTFTLYIRNFPNVAAWVDAPCNPPSLFLSLVTGAWRTAANVRTAVCSVITSSLSLFTGQPHSGYQAST